MSSKTPDDKLTRYLQRIQKLVGHRAKSPVLTKSRTRSPMNIKTSRIDSFLKHQMFFKSVFKVWDQYHKKLKFQFLNQLFQEREFYDLKIVQQMHQQKKENFNRIQIAKKQVKKQNDKPLAVRFFIKAFQSILNRNLRNSLKELKQYERYESQFELKTIKIPHRRTYSQIYAQSVSKYQSKSPSTSRGYENRVQQIYKTQSIFKKQQIYKKQEVQKKQQVVRKQQITKNLKNIQTKYLIAITQKMILRRNQSIFSQIKNYQCRNLKIQLMEVNRLLLNVQKQCMSLKKQFSKMNQSNIKLQNSLQQKSQSQEFNSIEFRSRSKTIKSQYSNSHQVSNNLQLKQLNKEIKQNLAIFKIIQVLSKKQTLFKTISYKKLQSHKDNTVNIQSKFILLANILKRIIKQRKKLFYSNLISIYILQNNFRFTQSKDLIQKQSVQRQSSNFKQSSVQRNQNASRQQTPPQRSQTPSQIKIQSLYSSKNSLMSSQKSINHNFDHYTIKINKAFSIKFTLNKIYFQVFQKIDQSAFLYLRIQNPIKKLVNKTIKESFRKILFYSFYKSQLNFKNQQRSIRQSMRSSIRQSIRHSQVLQQNKSIQSAKFIKNNPSIRNSQSFIQNSKSIQKSYLLQRSQLIQKSIQQIQSSIIQKTKNRQKLLQLLKKIQKKILFMKIQAYSIIKLNNQLKKTTKISQDVIISQQQLKKQVKQFLLQRNKIHQKTYQNWNKTKQMLQSNYLQQIKTISNRAHLSRISA